MGVAVRVKEGSALVNGAFSLSLCHHWYDTPSMVHTNNSYSAAHPTQNLQLHVVEDLF
jgi:hypothetical protein